VLWNAANPYPAIVFKETQAAGQTLTIEVQSLEIRASDDFDGAFEMARKQRPDALITVEEPLTFNYQKRIADFALTDQLPLLHGVREFAVAGGLMSYGANVADVYRRAASYVDKILKGAKPADLPVQQPTKFELVINLQTPKRSDLQCHRCCLLAPTRLSSESPRCPGADRRPIPFEMVRRAPSH